jgi:GT2 family glycosyltransferase
LTGLTACDTRPFQLIVVDNAPVKFPAVAAAAAFGARYVLEPDIGLSRARNAGVRAAAGDAVAFIDDDAAPDCNWLAAVAAAFLDPEVGVVTGDIVPLTSTPDPGAYRVAERRLLRRSHGEWFEIASFGGVGNGGNMAFRRDALLRVGGFDARLGAGAPLPGCEEHEAFMRVVEAGYAAVSDPSAVVFHEGSARDWRRRAAVQFALAFPYILFLFRVKRGYRARIARYGIGALFGKRRRWRSERRPALLTQWQRATAALMVPRLAWRALTQSSSATSLVRPVN